MDNFESKDYQIISKDKKGPNLYTFKLAGKLNFRPGQFIQVCLPHIGEAAFAPTSNPGQKDFELCIRGCGATTNEIIKLLPGDILKIRGPHGNGWPVNQLKHKDIILVAGGMGLIPLRPLIFQLLENHGKYGKIYLFGGFRTKEHVLFLDDLVRWQKKMAIEIYVEQLTKDPFFHKGLITKPLDGVPLNIKKSVVLVCGPEAMIPFVTNTLSDRGFLNNQIYISYERRMECGIGICQHCNIGKYLVCKDGPVFRYDVIKPELTK